MLLRGYPFLEDENENVAGMMEDLRLQFRVVCANMGVRLGVLGTANFQQGGFLRVYDVFFFIEISVQICNISICTC
jgi:hypothetical protein